MASLSQGRTAAAQCGLFTYKSVPVIFEPPCISYSEYMSVALFLQHAKRKCRVIRVLPSVACLTLHYSTTMFHKRHDNR